MKPFLAVDRLSVTYRRQGTAPVNALADVDLAIAKGERLAIIGESGSGKSTLALAIGGLLPPSAAQSGAITWPGLAGPPVNGRDIGFVFQDPGASLDPLMTVGDQVAEVVATHLGLTRRQALASAEAHLARVELPAPRATLSAYPHQLSGGQRQRVAIAAAIAAGPALLIADEATSALDSIVQARIVALFERIAAEDGMAILFVSHDLALAAGLADRIAVFRHGRLVECGPTARLVGAPQHAYTQSLLAAHLGLDGPP